MGDDFEGLLKNLRGLWRDVVKISKTEGHKNFQGGSFGEARHNKKFSSLTDFLERMDAKLKLAPGNVKMPLPQEGVSPIIDTLEGILVNPLNARAARGAYVPMRATGTKEFAMLTKHPPVKRNSRTSFMDRTSQITTPQHTDGLSMPSCVTSQT